MYNFSQNKVALRIHYDSPLKNKKGETQQYEDRTDIILPMGAKVVFIDESEEGTEYNRILCYWKGAYRDGYIKSIAIIKGKDAKDTYFDYEEINGKSLEIFFNDIDHLLNERLSIYKIEGDLAFLLTTTKRKVASLKEKKNISENTLHLIRNRYIEYTTINKNNIPRSLRDISSLLFRHYNEHFAERVLILPLSEDWFQKNKELEKFYIKEIKKDPTNVGISQLFQFNVGEIIEDKARFDRLYLEVFPTLVKLLKFYKIEDAEARWLSSIDFKDKRKKEVKIISFGNVVWNYSPEKRLTMISSVGVNCIYGPFRLHPFVQLLAHELNVAGYIPYQVETHIPSFEIENTIRKYSNGDTQLLKTKEVDHLYQEHAVLSLIHINILLSLFY